MADRAVNLETVIGMVNTYFRNVLNLNPDLLIDGIVSLPTVDAVPVVRCKDCSKWCICHHSDNWFCADGTPISTASDFYDDKGKRLNNPQTYKSVYGERKDGDHHE